MIGCTEWLVCWADSCSSRAYIQNIYLSKLHSIHYIKCLSQKKLFKSDRHKLTWSPVLLCPNSVSLVAVWSSAYAVIHRLSCHNKLWNYKNVNIIKLQIHTCLHCMPVYSSRHFKRHMGSRQLFMQDRHDIVAAKLTRS